jgi:AraC-like DNA-binding protein
VEAVVSREAKEFARFRRIGVPGGLSGLFARYRSHAFAPHSHETFVIGVFDAGTSVVRCEREVATLSSANVLLINPGTIHSARAATSEGRTYRGIYPSIELVADALPEIPESQRRFDRTAIADPTVVSAVRADMDALFSDDEPGSHEEAVIRMIGRLWHAAGGARPRVAAKQPARELDRVQALIADSSDEPMSLRELAAEAGLSKYHLIRAFRRRFGVTPYAYFLERRVERARQLFDRGGSAAAVAAACGFADQSHLTRHFKRIVGVTPGEYATAVNAH